VKRYGLLAAGGLLLLLSSLAAWWMVDLSPNTDATTTPHSDDKPATANKGDAKIWVVWYGDDAALYRLRVSTAAYADLYAALRKALAQDQVRLESVAGGHLYAELTPIFAELPPRLGAFLESLFDLSNSSSLVGEALDAATEAIRATDASTTTEVQNAENAREQTRIHLADEVVTRFRDSVLLPGFTLRALRAASGRAFALLRQDLLEDCNRYDQAFRGFVLSAPGTVETRDGDAGWRADPSWQQGNATFLSLCQDLRRTDAGQLSDASVMGAFAAAEEAVHAQALELVRPMAGTAVDVALSTHGIATTLGNTFGLASGVARPIASGISRVSSAWTLVSRTFDRLGGAQSRERFSVGLQATLDALKTDGLQRLHSAYRSFIAAELEHIGLNLSARSEGVWSHQ
jgi:hypothetical protein